MTTTEGHCDMSHTCFRDACHGVLATHLTASRTGVAEPEFRDTELPQGQGLQAARRAGRAMRASPWTDTPSPRRRFAYGHKTRTRERRLLELGIELEPLTLYL